MAPLYRALYPNIHFQSSRISEKVPSFHFLFQTFRDSKGLSPKSRFFPAIVFLPVWSAVQRPQTPARNACFFNIILCPGGLEKRIPVFSCLKAEKGRELYAPALSLIPP